MRRALAIAAALLAAGCAGSDPGTGEPDGGGGDADAGVELTGDLLLGGADDSGAGFVDLVDGADAPLIAGAQGGYHVWTSLRARNMKGELRIDREARRVADGVLVLVVPTQELLVPDEAMEDWWLDPAPVPNFMCPTPIGIQVHDQAIEFTSWVRTVDGDLVGRDSITLVPRCPAGDEANCHARCSG
jgi:hypothetical protein